MATQEEILKRFTDELLDVDEVAQVVLKGHLLLEELMTEALETYLLHGEFISSAKLSFSQKINLCRGISTSEHKSSMWNLIGRINALRNALSHSLDPSRRAKAIDDLRVVYEQEFKDLPESRKGIPAEMEKEMSKELGVCLYALSGCLGFLHAFVEEVKRLKGLIQRLDEIYNKGGLAKATAQP